MAIPLCAIASKINDTPKRCQTARKLHAVNCSTLAVVKFDRSNKSYGQVDSLRLKSTVASKWASKQPFFGRGVTLILQVMVQYCNRGCVMCRTLHQNW